MSTDRTGVQVIAFKGFVVQMKNLESVMISFGPTGWLTVCGKKA